MKTRVTIPILLTLIILACGHDKNRRSELSKLPVDFVFTLSGKDHSLSEFRGRPLLLVLMRTSEISSQAYMQEVRKAFAKSAGITRFLVLTIEPNEAPFVEAYVEFEKLPFPIGVAEPMLREGKSALGLIPPLPCTYVIDRNGYIVNGALGVIPAPEIVKGVEALEQS